MSHIKNDKDALTQALILAVTAPTDKLQQIIQLAEEFASTLTDEEIEECKQRTVEFINAQYERSGLSQNEIH